MPINQDPQMGSSYDIYACVRRFSRIGVAFAVLTLVTTLAQSAFVMVPVAFGSDIVNAWWYNWLLSLVPLYGFGLPAMYLVLRGVPKAPVNTLYMARTADGGREAKEKPAFTVGWFAVIAVIAMGYMYIGSMMGQSVTNTLAEWLNKPYDSTLGHILDSSPLWMIFACTVVLAPIGEEFIFRKLFMERTRYFGDTVSILLSAFLFALFHGNLEQFFYAFLLGLLLGYLYARTGQLRWSVFLHMLVNFLGSIVPLCLQSLVDMEALSSSDPQVVMQAIADAPLGYALVTLYSLLINGLMLAAVILTLVLFRCVKLGRGEITLRREDRLGVVLGNAGMLAAFVVGMLLILLSLLP